MDNIFLFQKLNSVWRYMMKAEFAKTIKTLMSSSDKPILLEVFTKKDLDAKVFHEFYSLNQSFDAQKILKEKVKKIAHGSSFIETTLRKAKNKIDI